MDDNAIDKVVMVAVAAAIGAILICSLVIPVFDTMLGTLTLGQNGNLHNISDGDLTTWKTLLSLAVMMTVIGFIIAIIKGGVLSSKR